MLFGRRKKQLDSRAGKNVPPGHDDGRSGEHYFLDYEMFLKGPIVQRNSEMVRQATVTLNGATRLVTSGDKVDRATLEALLESGAVRAPEGFESHGDNPGKKRSVVDDVASSETGS